MTRTSHEAAHGILDLDQDVVVSFATPSTRDRLVEVRANTFAARYVLPPSVVRGLPVKQWDPTEAVRWANQFKVSTTALAISLKEADLIDESTARRLQGVRVPAESKVDPELNGMQGRMLVRKRELLERGLSSYYVELCFEALSKGLISSGRAAEMMLIDDFGLGEIAALFGLSVQAL
jgi:Zn-dependent peptidase ImmA (M78 family)